MLTAFAPSPILVKPSRLVRSSDRRLHEMYFPKPLAGLIRRERARADRQQGQFSVVMFRLTTSRSRWSTLRLSRLVLGAVRTTDEVGLYDRHTVCAVLPNTGSQGSSNLVRRTRDICSAHGLSIVPVVYAYPSKPLHGDNDRESPLSDDATLRPVGLPRETRMRLTSHIEQTVMIPEVKSMEPLFCRRPSRLKRTLDVAVAGAVIAAASPVLLAIAAAIKLGDNGPVLFNQTRSGLGGRPFKIFKFRTMCVDADRMKAELRGQSEQDGPAFKMTHDPRVTRLGRLLRKTSLDELPQLFNVLRGDMSLVGPRPLPVDEQAACDPWHRARLDVTPGLTCIWQVKGRSRVSFDDWMRMDLSYTKKSRIVLDVKLLLQTVPAVLLRRGAK